jgi:MFS family permease
MSTFRPSTTLASRTFIGLLIAQFFAAFNDQAIHASAMFFAIDKETMSPADAISLMPILFYAPWALFGTLAGWLADRFSKRNSLIAWKIAEIGITLLALLGFWLGSHNIGGQLGPWLVLSTVFLMGTHSTFFVPAKYGCMPEILAPHLLSKGNGLLESLSFLAVILGTVCGGVMFWLFKEKEYYIGIVLVALAVIGAVASFLIQKMPAADPTRPFPVNLFKPIVDNFKIMLRSRPVALAVIGIAFFTFVLVYMRGTMYIHGETRNPRWTELDTSLIVGTVALGIGLGSPMAGFLSGGKVELGLVPFGGLGMILALSLAALLLDFTSALVVCLILVGFFTSFYLVPMFTLLQHRAPKQSKGDLLATSNVINVTGAIVASLLFKGLVLGAAYTGMTPPSDVPVEVARGVLQDPTYDNEKRLDSFKVRTGNKIIPYGSEAEKDPESGETTTEKRILRECGKPKEGSEVVVGEYKMKRERTEVTYLVVQPADRPLERDYNREPLTRFLFLGAAFMTFCILALLRWQLPDLYLRTLLWGRSLRRRRMTVLGMNNLPTDGPAILATSADSLDTSLLILSAVDRYARFLLVEAKGETIGWVIRYMARRRALGVLQPATPETTEWKKVEDRADKALKRAQIVAFPLNGGDSAVKLEELVEELGARRASPVVPVYCAVLPMPDGSPRQSVYVVFGSPMAAGTPAQAVRSEIQRLGDELNEQLRQGVDLGAAAVEMGH